MGHDVMKHIQMDMITVTAVLSEFSTILLWFQFIEMVYIPYEFVIADCRGKWALLLKSTKDILSSFATSEH